MFLPYSLTDRKFELPTHVSCKHTLQQSASHRLAKDRTLALAAGGPIHRSEEFRAQSMYDVLDKVEKSDERTNQSIMTRNSGADTSADQSF